MDFPNRLVQILSKNIWTICPKSKLDLDYSWTSKNLDSDLHLYSGPFPPIGKFLPAQWWNEFRQKILRAPHSGT